MNSSKVPPEPNGASYPGYQDIALSAAGAAPPHHHHQVSLSLKTFQATKLKREKTTIERHSELGTPSPP